MKAKIINTGEVVEVHKTTTGWASDNLNTTKKYETVSWYDEKMRHVTGCVGDTSSSGKAEAYQSVIDKLNSM